MLQTFCIYTAKPQNLAHLRNSRGRSTSLLPPEVPVCHLHTDWPGNQLHPEGEQQHLRPHSSASSPPSTSPSPAASCVWPCSTTAAECTPASVTYTKNQAGLSCVNPKGRHRAGLPTGSRAHSQHPRSSLP